MVVILAYCYQYVTVEVSVRYVIYSLFGLLVFFFFLFDRCKYVSLSVL